MKSRTLTNTRDRDYILKINKELIEFDQLSYTNLMTQFTYSSNNTACAHHSQSNAPTSEESHSPQLSSGIQLPSTLGIGITLNGGVFCPKVDNSMQILQSTNLQTRKNHIQRRDASDNLDGIYVHH